MKNIKEKRPFDVSPKFLGSGAEMLLAPAALKTFSGVRDDLRLKAALKKAVSREEAPQYLIEAIREAVRRG